MATQSKISAFFKPTVPSRSLPIVSSPASGDSAVQKSTSESEITITYERKSSNAHRKLPVGNETKEEVPKLEQGESSKVLNKKRNYAQLHLEVGQSDFLLHMCSTCGFTYNMGDESDERAHKTIHKNYSHGVPFKGWRNERIVDALEFGRIVLVHDGDAFSHQNKVQDVVHVMERELGEGWILGNSCKVYLYISSQRVAGCLVVEPIKEAYRILPSSVDDKCSDIPARVKRKTTATLQFGSISLHREIVSKKNVESPKNEMHNGAIICEDDALPAICGVRAIWVSPSNRRKHIASHLLDGARKSFCTGLHLDHTQVAFSAPTALGRAFISSYTRTKAFLIYKTSNTD